MHELTGKAQNLALDIKTGKAILTLEVNEKNDALNCFDELQWEDKLSIKIDKYREKRSLDANAYAWKLITEIANVIRSSKNEVYVEMLKSYGQSDIFTLQAHIPISGYVKYYDEIGEGETNGKTFKHYRVYKGSSEYDTREMSIFIDGIVSEADGLGIQTKTPAQLAEMKSLWRAAK